MLRLTIYAIQLTHPEVSTAQTIMRASINPDLVESVSEVDSPTILGLSSNVRSAVRVKDQVFGYRLLFVSEEIDTLHEALLRLRYPHILSQGEKL